MAAMHRKSTSALPVIFALESTTIVVVVGVASLHPSRTTAYVDSIHGRRVYNGRTHVMGSARNPFNTTLRNYHVL